MQISLFERSQIFGSSDTQKFNCTAEVLLFYYNRGNARESIFDYLKTLKNNSKNTSCEKNISKKYLYPR